MSNEMKDWLEENEREEEAAAMSIAECQVETQKHLLQGRAIQEVMLQLGMN